MTIKKKKEKSKTHGSFAKAIKRLFFVLMILLVAVSLWAGYIYITLPEVSYLKTKNPKSTALIEQRKKEAQENGKKIHIRQRWVHFDAIPKLLKQTVRISEDASFYQHEGIDYHELQLALKRNLEEGKKVRGASTITQQLAKNLFLSTEKSYYRKIKEVLIAKRLEKQLSKNRIFHLYLNVIEFGEGIYGVEAASEFFFKKPVNRLSLVEIVRLVAVIPKPLKVSPLSKSRYLKWRTGWLLELLERYGYISQGEYEQAKRDMGI